MLNAEIRRLAPADWQELRDARLTALEEAPDAFASTLEAEVGQGEEQWRERFAASVFFGAAQPGHETRLVGLVGGFAEPAGHATPDDGEGGAWHLISMWVAPQARGNGIADELVTAICDVAREAGARQIALWVTDGNDRARAFYTRAGFRGTGQRQIIRHGEPDLWEERMIRDLV
jgi:ribosomal protein S18 acetylase RimI-like enzyme